jgi:hypothetical protein
MVKNKDIYFTMVDMGLEVEEMGRCNTELLKVKCVLCGLSLCFDYCQVQVTSLPECICLLAPLLLERQKACSMASCLSSFPS